jgi:tRNAThr (cytosine32-N3)-methyltransferase
MTSAAPNPALPQANNDERPDIISSVETLKLTSRDDVGGKSANELSEIQKVAHSATPPTAPNSRTTPLANHLKRTDPFQFGSRYLEADDDVFAWNAWDHVDPSQDPAFMEYAEAQYAFQKANAVSDFDRKRFNTDPQKWWDKFYGNNEANFFKDRKWLRQEFPVLVAATTANSEQAASTIKDIGANSPASEAALACLEMGPWNTILEVGAGAGNTAFPLARENSNPDLMIHACDFSAKAVRLIQNSDQFVPKHMAATQWDMAGETLPPGVEPGSVDIVLMIFAFSALAPAQWRQAVRNIWNVLRPGGEVGFRDYGRGDLAQVRFKKGRLLEENFYVRGDGTRVYFFEADELRKVWSGQPNADSDSIDEGAQVSPLQEDTKHVANQPKFEIVTLATDRRLLVNRQKQLKMYRCWQQGRFRKPTS